MHEEIVSISLDILEGHQYGYIEIETLEDTNEREVQLYEIFDNVAFNEWRQFDLREEMKSMLSMSKDVNNEGLGNII